MCTLFENCANTNSVLFQLPEELNNFERNASEITDLYVSIMNSFGAILLFTNHVCDAHLFN